MSLPDRPTPVKSRDRQLTRRGVLWLGLRCDVRCKFCYDEHVPAARKGWLPLADATRALDKFRSYYGNQFVDFMGGEPTLHPQILDITAHAARIGFRGPQMPATAPAMFINALALPEYSGAMSIVAVHIGEIEKPRKNNANVNAVTPMIRSWTKIAGTSRRPSQERPRMR